MPCGVVLREALKNESIAAIILYDQSREGEKAVNVEHVDLEAKQTGEGVFWNFFSWIDGGAFEVSTDAFTTFRVMISWGGGSVHQIPANRAHRRC